MTTRRFDVWLFFALACAITWAADAPLALAWAWGREPAPWAMPLVALGAFGPLIAAAQLSPDGP